MSTREQAARDFAAAMGWEFVGREEYADFEHPEYFGQFDWKRSAAELAAAEDDDEMESLGIPPADAPLHEHLAFVGRVAEAICVEGGLIDWNRLTGHGAVTWPYQKTCEATDISWAALLAATAAKVSS